ncbi:hypothetical protein BX600DRAFT_456988 [Xylariales sp. PMI_506]|nr:hypothetical protein BX600DRAFT_456988 [Xylariales sp. PMI_506]
MLSSNPPPNSVDQTHGSYVSLSRCTTPESHMLQDAMGKRTANQRELHSDSYTPNSTFIQASKLANTNVTASVLHTTTTHACDHGSLVSRCEGSHRTTTSQKSAHGNTEVDEVVRSPSSIFTQRQHSKSSQRESSELHERYRKSTLLASEELYRLQLENQMQQQLPGDNVVNKPVPLSSVSTNPAQRPLYSPKYKEGSPLSTQYRTKSSQTFGSISKPASIDIDLYRSTPIAPPNHECSWKDRYIALTAEIRLLKAEMSVRTSAAGMEQRINEQVQTDMPREDCEDLGIQGVTIVMHLRGKDDLVINTDLTQDLEG